MISKKIITAKNISKVIKDKYILKDVSFDISEGELSLIHILHSYN